MHNVREIEQMLQYGLIHQCSATLASIKTASLFRMNCACTPKLLQRIEAWNARLHHKGVFLTVLYAQPDATLIYVCRRSHLQADLEDVNIAQFLQKQGYAQNNTVEGAIHTLQERFRQQQGFPHEIGVFLGYPVADVIGFIQNGGKNSKCTGYWKVYTDEQYAQREFARIKKCTNVYCRMWQSGTSICRLTVAA